MRQFQRLALLIFSILLIAACDEAKLLDIRTQEGKTSPYQNVEKVILNPVVELNSCSPSNSEIPDALRSENVIDSIKSSIEKFRFNARENGETNFVYDISVSSKPYQLADTDLRINLSITYRCDNSDRVASVRWETERASQLNAYIRKSEDLWATYEEPRSSTKIAMDQSDEEIEKVLKWNTFQRVLEDSCLRETHSGIPEGQTPVKKEVVACP